jgi:hypothetical protein
MLNSEGIYRAEVICRDVTGIWLRLRKAFEEILNRPMSRAQDLYFQIPE